MKGDCPLRLEWKREIGWTDSANAGLRPHGLTIAARDADLFVTREKAEAELAEILEDEPDWQDVLSVVPIQLDGREVSMN